MLKKSICLIDPIKNVLDVYRMILEEKGYAVDTAIDLEEALHGCFLNYYSVIITEYFTPLEKMHHFIRSIKESTPETYQIMSTSVNIDDLNYKKLFDMGLDDLLVKPYGLEKLLAHIEKGIKRQELCRENQKNEQRLFVDPINREDSPAIFTPPYFKRLIRQELKKAKRHQQALSLILLKLPSKEIMAEGFEPFYFELIRLLRKSLREEDLLGREDGHLGILLQQTDQSASQNLGRRLSTLIQTLPSFRTNSSLQTLFNEFPFQYYTFPNQSDIPEFVSPLLEEIDKEFPSS